MNKKIISFFILTITFSTISWSNNKTNSSLISLNQQHQQAMTRSLGELKMTFDWNVIAKKQGFSDNKLSFETLISDISALGFYQYIIDFTDYWQSWNPKPNWRPEFTKYQNKFNLNPGLQRFKTAQFFANDDDWFDIYLLVNNTINPQQNKVITTLGFEVLITNIKNDENSWIWAATNATDKVLTRVSDIPYPDYKWIKVSYWDRRSTIGLANISLQAIDNTKPYSQINSQIQNSVYNFVYYSDYSNAANDIRHWNDLTQKIKQFILDEFQKIKQQQNNYDNHPKIIIDHNQANEQTITIMIYYQTLFANQQTITNTQNPYYLHTSFRFTFQPKILYTSKFLSNQIWQKLILDETNKIVFDFATNKLTIAPYSAISANNPWKQLLSPPIPANNQVNYPDFGTFYFNHDINLKFNNLNSLEYPVNIFFSGNGPNVSVTNQQLQSIDGQYLLHLYDGRFKANITTNTLNQPTEWTIEVKGLANATYQTVFKIKFVINAYFNQNFIQYRGWNPSVPILDQTQGKWIQPKLRNEENNPLYKPILDPQTGLGQQLVWLYGNELNPKTAISQYWPQLLADFADFAPLPDPISPLGEKYYQIYTKNPNGEIDYNYANTIKPLSAFAQGILANAFVAPRGIDQLLQPNQVLYRFELIPFVDQIQQVVKLKISSNKMQRWTYTSNSQINYNDQTGLYLYVLVNLKTQQNPQNTYGIYLLALDQNIKDQNFTTYVTTLLNKFSQTKVLKIQNFWSSDAGKHLSVYMTEFWQKLLA